MRYLLYALGGLVAALVALLGFAWLIVLLDPEPDTDYHTGLGRR